MEIEKDGILDIDHARIFVQVVRSGGFSGAARQLRLPKSTVSARIRALELRLGTQLLKRTTRKIAMTTEGQAYFDAVAQAVDSLIEAETVLAGEAGVLSGVIRFTAPVEFPLESLSAALRNFCARHPKVRFEILLTNEPLDMVANNIDLALRGGEPTGSGLVIRKVGTFGFGLYASPAYIRIHGRPGSRRDLASHAVLAFGTRDRDGAFVGINALGVKVPLVISDSFRHLHELAAAGVGIALLPDPLAAPALADGQLERLEVGLRAPPANLFLVYPSRRDMSARVRAFAECLVEALATK